MAPPKKKAATEPTPEGAIISVPGAEEVQEDEVEVEHTTDVELEVGLEGLGVAAKDIAAWRCLEAAVARVASRAQQAVAAHSSTSQVRTRQLKGKAITTSNIAEVEEIRHAN